ncbi:hypothetical protein PIB30_095542 [Stylosanthes scabra]|uniref:Uncharacterized protein n=1 Tax=Stylosanthes scabra TaxID=79078 RepID=A0ABU6XVD7_9FABA|nr:hypothetical protein [Stylosanthes scabra]
MPPRLKPASPLSSAALYLLNATTEKEQKEAWKARKEENRATGQNRAKVSITQCSCLGATTHA